MGIVSDVQNKSVARLLGLFILGFIAQLEVGGESYEFSKVDLESVTILIALRSLFGLEN